MQKSRVYVLYFEIIFEHIKRCKKYVNLFLNTNNDAKNIYLNSNTKNLFKICNRTLVVLKFHFKNRLSLECDPF